MDVSFLVAFSLGLVSTLHCWGMCGGIIGALSIGISDKNTLTLKQKSTYLLALNTGRISSYTIAGIIAGLFSVKISQLLSPAYGHMIMKFAAAIVLILIGLHLAGWLPKFRHIESFGNIAWHYLQPLGKRLLPVNTIPKAFAIGMIWGWLPCALVYSVLLWALTSANVFDSVFIMFSFGVGTLPGMYMAGIASSGLFNLSKRQSLRRAAGVVIMIFGLASPFILDSQHMRHVSITSHH